MISKSCLINTYIKECDALLTCHVGKSSFSVDVVNAAMSASQVNLAIQAAGLWM